VEVRVDAEAKVTSSLREILSPLPAGSPLADSRALRELEQALEYFIPPIVGMREGLDGFRCQVARKVGAEGAEFIGVALLIADQAWTPIWLRMRMSPEFNALAWLDCRLGEAGAGARGMVRMPWESTRLTKLLFHLPERVEKMCWVYAAERGK